MPNSNEGCTELRANQLRCCLTSASVLKSFSTVDRLTARQLGHLDEMIAIGEELTELKQSRQKRDSDKNGP
jgi:hypothetical protein